MAIVTSYFRRNVKKTSLYSDDAGSRKFFLPKFRPGGFFASLCEKIFCSPWNGSGKILYHCQWSGSGGLGKSGTVAKTAENQAVQMEGRREIYFMLFGSHTSSYNLDNLIRAVKQLPDERIQVLFVGEGTYKKHLQKMAAEDSKTKSRFWFHPYIPKRSIPSLIQQVDGVYIGIQPCILQKYGICMNKLFDAMMGGKPILFSAAFPNNYVDQYKCGITVAPEDTAGLTKAIKRLRDMSEEERERMGENGRRAVKEEFTYDRLAEQFEKVFDGFFSV